MSFIRRAVGFYYNERSDSKVKIIHISDLHLDTPFQGMSHTSKSIHRALIQAPYQAFESCVNYAITNQIDVMLITGDIYNSQRQTIQAQRFFNQQLERLLQEEIQVVFCHGNHDFIREGYSQLHYPEGIHLLKDESVSKVQLTTRNEETLTVYGFSYCHQALTERMIDQFPVNQDNRSNVIGLLHGALQTSHPQQNRYAPFTLQDLKDKQYSYFALGHIHKPQILSEFPLIQYAGTPQGRHRNEVGAHGCYLIELVEGSVIKKEFIPLAEIIWENCEIECPVDASANDLVELIRAQLNQYEQRAIEESVSFILTVHLLQSQRLNADLWQQIRQGELFEVITTRMKDDQFVLVNQFELANPRNFNVFEFDQALRDQFTEVEQAMSEASNRKEVLDDFLAHPIVRRYFEQEELLALSEDYINQAKELIVQSVGMER